MANPSDSEQPGPLPKPGRQALQELRIYRSVVLPGIVPILATLAIWTFPDVLATWSDFM